MPARVSHAATPVAGAVAAFAMRGKRKMLERHLRRVTNEISDRELHRASRRALTSYVRYYAESFRLPRLSASVVAERFKVDGFEHVEAGLERGNGVILALPHLGGWEWAGRWMTDRGHKLHVVVEPLRPPELFEWFTQLRSDLGMSVMPLGPNVAVEVSAALKRNEIVCLLCDRDIQRNGIAVTMFGEETTLPAGPAMLAIRTGATLLPTAVYFGDAMGEHQALVKPHLGIERSGRLRDDVAVLTGRLAEELEDLISRAPDQWHLLQPNWPSDPGYQIPSGQ